ncbi:hypothetical protein ACFYVL_02520 [Streptomyces sp. NPDC004111]|uniref:hypothetical protein n=1 Tax=Streptomyces sp. NPDC004111 TaxID=3364690 RepID=UPI00368C6BF6
MKRFSSDVQDRINAIIEAVATDDVENLNALIDAFLQDADLDALFALRAALEDSLHPGSAGPEL